MRGSLKLKRVSGENSQPKRKKLNPQEDDWGGPLSEAEKARQKFLNMKEPHQLPKQLVQTTMWRVLNSQAGGKEVPTRGCSSDKKNRYKSEPNSVLKGKSKGKGGPDLRNAQYIKIKQVSKPRESIDCVTLEGGGKINSSDELGIVRGSKNFLSAENNVSSLRKKTRIRTIREMLIIDSNTLPVSGVGADQQSQVDRETAAVSPAKQDTYHRCT